RQEGRGGHGQGRGVNAGVFNTSSTTNLSGTHTGVGEMSPHKQIQCIDGKAWEAGFLAGQQLLDRCPYAAGTQEEWDWHAAWREGAAKCLGLRYSRTAAERDARHPERSPAMKRHLPSSDLPPVFSLAPGAGETVLCKMAFQLASPREWSTEIGSASPSLQ
ncbi:hypothetical protein, partial [Azohydromonas australica]|uniref:hypothetical protein n=1 Tax=Azohydromonas australica TaxID=364039 RepID=UPI001B7FAA8C